MRTGRPAPTAVTRAATLVALAVLAAPACSAAASGGGPRPEVTATQPLAGPESDGDRDSGKDGADPTSGPTSSPADEAAPAEGATDEGALHGRTIAVDPGHNGGNADAPEEIGRLVPSGPGEKACDTVGAESRDGHTEHEFTWDFANRLREHLRERGATVVLTRDSDTGVGPCVNERAEIGNEADADAAISIHADGSTPEGRGFHVIAPGVVEGYTDDIAQPSLRLAKDVRAEFREGSGQPYADYVADSGLDVRTDLGGLNLSDVPKVFLEAGNMRNATDAGRLADADWRDRAADATAEGIERYLTRD